MKKIIVSALAVCIPLAAFAHPPKSVTATYDRATKSVTIIAEHQVKDVAAHYIDEIEIEVNGKNVAKAEYKVQSSLESHQAVIVIGDVAPGSKIEVDASCNKFGSKSVKFTAQ